ncbi:ImmA/IrrE family metallo-endopeptidase [Phascolarctobacterium succinatutens]|jgi:Zn-dependent peptidase ImmA (M78 family)|uniref:ImmA/IrrE family metallo-endopeptidase n=1 Tax=Phascolarctobacterium succinatutens TaxID=626940 RepID=UPI0020713100|nr:MAG TPA: IrrE protein [Caudoviricetes sp.]
MAYNYKLRVKHLVEKAGSSNPAIIAEMLSINIRYVDTPNNINGFWKRILRRKFIFVNERLDEWQRMTVISHELGHILLHPHYHHFCSEGRSYFASSRHENEADNFAMCLMDAYGIDPIYSYAFLQNGWR